MLGAHRQPVSGWAERAIAWSTRIPQGIQTVSGRTSEGNNKPKEGTANPAVAIHCRTELDSSMDEHPEVGRPRMAEQYRIGCLKMVGCLTAAGHFAATVRVRTVGRDEDGKGLRGPTISRRAIVERVCRWQKRPKGRSAIRMVERVGAILSRGTPENPPFARRERGLGSLPPRAAPEQSVVASVPERGTGERVRTFESSISVRKGRFEEFDSRPIVYGRTEPGNRSWTGTCTSRREILRHHLCKRKKRRMWG